MTVKELIEELQDCPQDLPVYVWDCDTAEIYEALIGELTVGARVDIAFSSES